MKTTTLQLLPTTSYGTPSGNYDGSSLDWAGPAQQAANYYGGFGGLQTVAYFLSGFQGLITIEGSLEGTPATAADWFRIDSVDALTDAVTDNFSHNITGNFTWIRARVEDFDDCTITKLMLSY